MSKIFPIKLVISLLLALTVLGTAPALAASDIWSFADNPHPRFDDLTDEEKAFIDTFRAGDATINECERWILAEYEVYKRRNPEFEASGAPDETFRDWKVHLSRDRPGAYNTCLSLIAMDILSDANPPPSDFYFCGRYSRPPASAEELRYARLIDELFVYAQSTAEASVNDLLFVNELTSIVDLAAEVEYYFRQLIPQVLKDEIKPRDVSHLLPGFTTSQKALLDEAVEKRDLQAVFDMAGTCEQR
jgi:hypothetical protein